MPTVVLPKIAGVNPTRNRLRPQVASMVSIMRPYRNLMIARSTMMPINPTTTGAMTSIEIQMLTPWLVATIAAYPPSIRNSPCARLITRIMPKIIASPTLISARLATAYRTWIARSVTRSTCTFPNQGLRRTASDLDYILLIIGRVLDEVANRCGIGRLLLGEIFEHLELLVVDFGDVNVEHAMMRRRIDGHLSGRSIDADPGLQRVDDFAAVDAAGLLHGLCPQLEALIGPHSKLGNVGIIRAKAFVEVRNELRVRRILQILEIIVADQHPVAFLRRQHDVFVADRERGRCHWDALAHAGGGPLPVERDMRAADQRRPHEIRLGRLNFGNGRS